MVRACAEQRRAVRGPRLGHRPVRRRAAPGRRRARRHLADAHDPGGTPRRPARRRGAGRDQPRRHPGGGAARLLLRARPLEPAGLLDRRQRRGELRRRALPEVRLHHQPRARRRAGDAGRRRRRAGRPRPRQPRATTCWARSSAPRARWASPPRSRVRLVRAPEEVRTLLAGFASTDDAGAATSAIIARGDRAGGDRDDGRARDRGGRGGRALQLPGRRRRGAGRSSSTGRPSRSSTSSREVERLCRGARRVRDPGRRRRRRARADLEGPQVRVRRGRAGSARTTSCRTA